MRGQEETDQNQNNLIEKTKNDNIGENDVQPLETSCEACKSTIFD